MDKFSKEERAVRIKEERKRLGLTQKTAAKAMGVSHLQWGRYERAEQGFDGEPLKKFGMAGADVSYILTGIRQHPQAKHVNDTLKSFLHLLPEEQRAKHEQKLTELEVETAQIQAKRMGRYLDAIRLFNSLDDETFDRVELNILDSYQAMVLRSK